MLHEEAVIAALLMTFRKVRFMIDVSSSCLTSIAWSMAVDGREYKV